MDEEKWRRWEKEGEAGSLLFVSSLVAVLRCRLTSTRAAVMTVLRKGVGQDDKSVPGAILAHGILRALPGVLGQVGPANMAGEKWRPVLSELTALANQGLEVALSVTGSGSLIAEEDGNWRGSVAKAMEDGGSNQVAVVGGWLLAKESALCLARLLEELPIGRGEDSSVTTAGKGKGDVELLTPQQAEGIGEMLGSALFELRHQGATASAQEAFTRACSVLLRHCNGSGPLVLVPARWMQELLHKITTTTSTTEFVIRRSAGIASSVLGMLKAEPYDISGPQLLPLATTQLLELAQSPHVHARVHSLNVLRVLFLDACIAKEMNAYVSAALTIAMEGLDHPQWTVRNSSVMVFSAVLRLTVGNDQNVDASMETSGSGKLSAMDFFSLYPELRACLLSRLQEAADSCEAQPKFLPAVLQPLLVLLSRLGTRGAYTCTFNLEADTEPFIPALIRVLGNKHALTRSIAACALVAAVPSDKVTHITVGLIESQPCLPPTQGANFSHNKCHGVLLAVQKLISIARSDTSQRLASGDPSPHSLGILAPALLLEREWLGLPSGMACPLNRLAMLRACEEMVSLLTDCPGKLETDALERVTALVGRLTRKNANCAVAQWGLPDDKMQLPGQVTLTRHVVLGCVRDEFKACLYGDVEGRGAGGSTAQVLREDEASGRLRSLLGLLSHEQVDVRDAALEAVCTELELEMAASQRSAQLSWSAVEATLESVLSCLTAESYPQSIEKLLRICCKIGELTSWPHVGNCPNTSMSVAIPAVRRLYAPQHSHQTPALALQVWGHCISPHREPAPSPEMVEEWAAAAEQAAQWESPQSLRFAAAASLAASQRIDIKGHAKAETPVSCLDVHLCFLVIKLLQDDSEEVRDFTNENVWGGGQALPVTLDAVLSELDRSFLCSFRSQGTQLELHPQLQLYVSRLLELGSTECSFSNTLIDGSTSATNPVYEADSLNLHSEQVLQSQLAAIHMRKLLSSEVEMLKRLECLETAQEDAVHSLRAVLSELEQCSHDKEGQGPYATYSPQVFESVYCRLMRAWALLPMYRQAVMEQLPGRILKLCARSPMLHPHITLLLQILMKELEEEAEAPFSHLLHQDLCLVPLQ
ncbi:unnamed protein product [Chrysoparadoxa australica]